MASYIILYDKENECSVRTTSDRVAEKLKKEHNLTIICLVEAKQIFFPDEIKYKIFNRSDYLDYIKTIKNKK